MDRGSRSARPLTGRAGADRTRTGGRGHCGREPGRSRPSRSDGAQSPGSPTSYHRPTGAMAQLAAHLLCKQGVTGSSPVGSTTFSPSSPCSSTGPPLPTPCASPPGPLSPYALRRGSPFPCPPPRGSSSPMPSSGGPPPICSLVRAVRSAESSLWGAAVGGEAGSRAGDSAHRTGAARAARPGRLRSGGAAPLGRATPATPERLLRPFPIPRSRAAASCAAPMLSVSSFAASPHTTRAPPRRSRRGRGCGTANPQRVGALWTSTPRRLPTPCG